MITKGVRLDFTPCNAQSSWLLVDGQLKDFECGGL